jgi:hypothetical protein
MTEPLFKLYSTVFCISDRPELETIRGQRVEIISRYQHLDGHWTYLVSEDKKKSSTFECHEHELEFALPRNSWHGSADTRSFLIIRQMLERHLHQDYDYQYGSIAGAIVAGLEGCDNQQMSSALAELELQSDDIVQDVLESHDVGLWEDISPREFLQLLKLLLKVS